MSESFWDLLFGDEKGGYVRVALNSKDKKHFKQEFVEWPNGRDKLETITKAKERGDIYFSPALFKEQDGKKQSVLGSRVGWVDLDQPYKESSNSIQPNVVVASGTPGRSHLYFQLPTLFPTETVETYNRYLCKEFGGDNSGWDANQLLRVPDTLNFKTDPPKPVKLVKLDPSQHWQIPKLDEISEPSEPLQLEGADLNETLLDHRLTTGIRSLLTQGSLECFDRSAALYRLGALSAEAGFEPSRIYALLEYADSRWGKFVKRDDKQLRLIEIVKRVTERRFSASFPQLLSEPEAELSPRPIGIFSLRKQTPPANWVVDQILREKGQTLIGGPTNIGKSPLAMSLAMSIAMGSADWMGFRINSQDERILFSALEMDGSEISEQVGPMLDMAKTPDNEARLEERLHILPVGHSIAADLKDGQEFYEALLEEHAYTGLILDTIGASVSTSLSEEKPMRAIVDWLARVRKRFGCWVVVLSHPRKDPAGAKWRDKEMDDFYGSRLIGDRSNVALIMDKGKNHPLILTNKKARFGKVGNTLLLNRMSNGWYSVVGEKEAADFRASVPNLQPTSNEDAVDVDKPNGEIGLG